MNMGRELHGFIVRGYPYTIVYQVQGEDSGQNRAKHAALAIWVQAVNAKGGFGSWCWDVAFQPAQIQDILARH